MQPINVLLMIEDDENDILLTERKIQRSQLPVEQLLIARTLTEGTTAVRHGTVDVVLLDLNLGDSRGLDTLAALRQVYNGVVVVLTSIEDERVGIEAIRMGASDYLVKNHLTEDRLRTTVAFAMTRHARDNVARRVQDNINLLSELRLEGK